MDLEDKRKDIALILKINQTFDLTKAAEARKVYSYVQKQKPFRTQVGTVYQARLQRLANGSSQNLSCLFCKKENVSNGVICQDCIDKLTGKSKKAPAAEPPMPSDSLSELSEKTASAVRNVTGRAEKALSFYHKLSRKNKIIIASVCVIIFLLLLTAGQSSVTSSSFGGSDNQNAEAFAGRQSSITAPSSFDEESAKEFVNQLFPSENYRVTHKNTIKTPKRMFEGQIGAIREYDFYGSSETVMTYMFLVVNNSSPSEYAILWLSETGRMIGQGSMVFEYDAAPNCYVRLI